ncbi:MAG: hypothetical protein IPN17_22840 [Deltaproteobacteria bacterium]|nr:hypothetical protein [Deltaproteobacteria bacterium]
MDDIRLVSELAYPATVEELSRGVGRGLTDREERDLDQGGSHESSAQGANPTVASAALQALTVLSGSTAVGQ